MEIAPGVHHFDTGPFNWYVLEEGGRLTLVDAGFPGHFGVFLKGIESMGRDIKDVAAVILTHAHADHMGFADRVGKAANAPVFIHTADLAASARILQLPWWGLMSRAWRPTTGSMLARGIVNGVFSLAKVSDARPFANGDILDVPGRPHVVHTPGHTPGEVSFYLPTQGVLLCGDTLSTRHIYTGEVGRPLLLPRPVNANHAQTVSSLDRLADLGTLTLLPGHGKPWHGPIRDAIGMARSGG